MYDSDDEGNECLRFTYMKSSMIHVQSILDQGVDNNFDSAQSSRRKSPNVAIKQPKMPGTNSRESKGRNRRE